MWFAPNRQWCLNAATIQHKECIMQEYTIKNPDAPMSDKQSYLLYRITGITLYYLESKPFTVKEASDLIDAAKNGKAYHTRLALAEVGGKVSAKDVHKDYRTDTKPRGYATKIKGFIGEEEPEKKAAATKKSTKKFETLAEELGLEAFTPEQVERLKAFKAVA